MKHHHEHHGCCGRKKRHMMEKLAMLEMMEMHGHKHHHHHKMHGHPHEGRMTVAIEKQTSKVASGTYLAAALGSMGASLALKCTGHKHTALFVGQWAAPLLIMGLYNKVVKTQGHD